MFVKRQKRCLSTTSSVWQQLAFENVSLDPVGICRPDVTLKS